MASSLAATHEETKAIFRKYDSAGRGFIGVDALVSILQGCGSSFRSEDVMILVANLDPENTGQIDYEAFIDRVHKLGEADADDGPLPESRSAVMEAFMMRINSGTAVQVSGAAAALRDDTEFMTSAVSLFGPLLASASARLQDDKSIVLAAVASRGWALEFASERLRDDDDVVLRAVQRDGQNLRFASSRLRSDASFVARAVAVDASALQFVEAGLRCSTRVSRAAAHAGRNSVCAK